MNLLLRGGRVIDPGRKIDAALDVRIEGGLIAEIGRGLASGRGSREIDASDRIVTPGLVDLHVHFREPGQEYKEDIATGSAAAASGGFTTVCCMPNTVPPNDCRTVTDLIVRRGREAGLCRVRPVGAISARLEGKALAEYGEMKEAGIVALSDDGRPVMNAGLMRRALEYARTFDLPVVQHAEDLSLAEGGVMNEGEVSTRLGLRGQPPQAESVMVGRDLELVEWTGARYHVAHASTARTIELVRQAKRRGLPVTCEVTPHHLHLTDDAVAAPPGYDTRAKVNPPLRGSADLEALREGLADGVIDCIATDHAPHSSVEKDVEFDHAAFGMIGLETALPLVLELVRAGVIDVVRAIALLSSQPARVFGLDAGGAGSLAPGAPADLTVIDLDLAWTVEEAAIRSRSHNTPFVGRALRGGALLTLMGGRVTFDRAGLVAS
ncbi:MAG TPA: dihydroorotase [Kofleriaceae bacterium]|nr:dihydroorotase [Kofleriaceae bacterium]